LRRFLPGRDLNGDLAPNAGAAVWMISPPTLPIMEDSTPLIREDRDGSH
jgi:hypothetical protein